MSITKVEEADYGDYVCVYLPTGWVQVKVEGEGVVIDVFDKNDNLFTTQAIFYNDLEPDEG
jgi:hypothetical protein